MLLTKNFFRKRMYLSIDTVRKIKGYKRDIFEVVFY